mmetsp:Transcript_3374/g.7745  ORF Transcript_3374/g.7745 Transcript_3374/m.7745 type:complete len:767 (+) Transcript_3374:64-2364(+)
MEAEGAAPKTRKDSGVDHFQPKRRTSLKAFQDGFKDLRQGFNKLQGEVRKKKLSLSHWKQYSTVSWTTDARKDYDEHTSMVIQKESNTSKALMMATSWFIPAFIGVLTATSGSLIEKAVEWLGDMRFGYCSTHMFFVNREQCSDGWVSWSDDLDPAQQSRGMFLQGFGCFIAISTVMATVSALLTWGFAPLARGSGIPEIKTILGGFVMKEVLEFNTLVIKILGLSLSVASGLSCGKEGPLVHIACCWANVISKFTTRYSNNEAKQRELLSTAAAAGVSVAFGAPLGGVLFSLEEVSTMFPNRTMVRSFFAAVVAALTLQQWDPTGTGKLTMFETSYLIPPKPVEYIIFIGLGVLGGCIGALFVHYNIIVSKARAPGTPFRKRCHIVLEVLLIALFTAITSYPFLYTRVLSSTAIRALFHSCEDMQVDKHAYMLDLCVPTPGADPWQPKLSSDLVLTLLLCGALRFVQMIFTFGTGAPAGLFVPSLYTGAALGRVVGIFVRIFHDYYLQTDYKVNPGIYAMIGAAAVLGGVCRVTISLVVIMFELTSGLQLIIPVMLAVLTAKWVGDIFTIGIYDYVILIRKYPFLHEPDEVTYHTVARQLMDEQIECLYCETMTIGQLIKFFKERTHGGYPLLRSPNDRTVVGYVHTRQMLGHLEKLREGNALMGDSRDELLVSFAKYQPNPPRGCMNVSKLLDETVLRLVPDTPAPQIHSIFRSLGVKLVLVTSPEGQLLGMVTKKSFIAHTEALHQAEHEPKHGRGLGERLLP